MLPASVAARPPQALLHFLPSHQHLHVPYTTAAALGNTLPQSSPLAHLHKRHLLREPGVQIGGPHFGVVHPQAAVHAWKGAGDTCRGLLSQRPAPGVCALLSSLSSHPTAPLPTALHPPPPLHRPLSRPEQLRHTKTPRLTDAQVGPRAPQSAHLRFSSCLSSWPRMRLCRSFCSLLTCCLRLETILPCEPVLCRR